MVALRRNKKQKQKQTRNDDCTNGEHKRIRIIV